MQSASGAFSLAFISSTGVEDDGIESSLTGGMYTGTVTPVTRSGLQAGNCGTALASFNISASFSSIFYRGFFDRSNPVCIYTSLVTISGLSITGLAPLDAALQPLMDGAIREDLHEGLDRDVADRLNRLFNNNQPLPNGNTGRCSDWEILSG
jgi:hypothetical protein